MVNFWYMVLNIYPAVQGGQNHYQPEGHGTQGPVDPSMYSPPDKLHSSITAIFLNNDVCFNIITKAEIYIII